MALKMGNGRGTICADGEGNYRRFDLFSVVTIFIVPAAYLLVYGGKQNSQPAPATNNGADGMRYNTCNSTYARFHGKDRRTSMRGAAVLNSAIWFRRCPCRCS